MSWLNTPVEIVESVRVQREQILVVLGGTEIYQYGRTVTWTRSRWVGGTKAAAQAKAASYLKNSNAETEVVRAGEAGQYQCIVTLKTETAWE